MSTILPPDPAVPVDPASLAEDLGELRRARPGYLAGRAGLLPRQTIRELVRRGVLKATADFEESQFQPASLDLRLGSKAYRVRASFLPGRSRSVQEQLDALHYDVIHLDDGAVLEKGCVYVVELLEHLELPEIISAIANPKSSTGRIDVFTRLIADRSDAFDTVASGASTRLYAEVSPRSFSIKIRRGTRLNQIRFRRRTSSQDEHGWVPLNDRELLKLHEATAIVDGKPKIRRGLMFSVALAGLGEDRLIGYRAQRHTDVVDVDGVGRHRIEDYWEPIRARPDGRLILDPNEFYILASKERVHIPPGYAAEMAPIEPTMGEFRVHYAGFFDPGFGAAADGTPASRAVLEVRSHEVPFLLEDGQVVGRLAFETMAEAPDGLYGSIGSSNYQGQSLKLSKHFA